MIHQFSGPLQMILQLGSTDFVHLKLAEQFNKEFVFPETSRSDVVISAELYKSRKMACAVSPPRSKQVRVVKPHV